MIFSKICVKQFVQLDIEQDQLTYCYRNDIIQGCLLKVLHKYRVKWIEEIEFYFQVKILLFISRFHFRDNGGN